MLRRALTVAVVLGVTGVGLAPAHAQSWQEDLRIAEDYAAGLRERGYYELADEYLEKLRTAPDAPVGLKATIDYEQGKLKLDEASKTGDLGLRKELLDQAIIKINAFTEANPNHPKASEALVEKAKLQLERGHLAMLQSSDAEDPKEKASKLALARESFDLARKAYETADVKLTKEFKAYPPFIPETESAKRAERDRAHQAMMDAQLQTAIVDYEQGQTYPPKSKERSDYLAKGLEKFEKLYRSYRTQMAGLTAQMFQGKCYEENDEIGKALGIYNALLEHNDPRLRSLQRHVGYFKIIAHAKRGEYPLAADLASQWLQKFNSPDEHRSREGLGVQLELAKSLIAQLPTIPPKEQGPPTRRATDVLTQVVRVASPFKAEAVTLLKKYKPKAAINAENLAKMGYEELIQQGEEAISSQDWDRAVAALKLAIRKADPAKDPDKANMARYQLAFCYYKLKKYYEAEVIADHLAHRYPRFSMSSEAPKLGMAALADAYNTYVEIDRGSDLTRLIAFAEYAAETWPDKEVGDISRMTLGQIYHGTGDYNKAVATYDSVSPKSKNWVEAQTKAGASHWEQSKLFRANNNVAGADEAVKKALVSLNGAKKARVDAGALPTDPELLSNVSDIAEINLDTGKPADALAMLEPFAKAQKDSSAPGYGRLMANMLRSHITIGQVDLALADMAALEKAGGGASLTSLYFSLGKLLEKERETLKAKGDSAGLARVSAAYLKFLNALANAKAGQTYESLEWVGENMLKLANPKEAAVVFQRLLDTIGKDKAFLDSPGSGDKLMRTRLKLSQALREGGDFEGATALVGELKRDNPKMLDPLIEEGYLMEGLAEADPHKWTAAANHWRALALRLAGAKPKPMEYYEAWYHSANALYRNKQPDKAVQLLNGAMRMTRVTTPELKQMKQKYDDLIKKIGSSPPN